MNLDTIHDLLVCTTLGLGNFEFLQSLHGFIVHEGTHLFAGIDLEKEWKLCSPELDWQSLAFGIDLAM